MKKVKDVIAKAPVKDALKVADKKSKDLKSLKIKMKFKG